MYIFVLDEICQSQESRNPEYAEYAEFPEGNIKSLLFSKAASKLQIDLKTIPSPFVAVEDRKNATRRYSTEFSSIVWAQFKFDRQAILGCL